MVRVAKVAVLLSAVGCAATHYHYVTPWFRIESTEAHSVIPHRVSVGGSSRACVSRPTGWECLADADGARAVGRAVVAWELGWERGRTLLFRQDGKAFVFPERCEKWHLRGDRVVCFSCGDQPPFQPTPTKWGPPCEARCAKLHLEEFDDRGVIVASRAVESPLCKPKPLGPTKNGEWILEDIGLGHTPNDLYALGANGFRRITIDEKRAIEIDEH